MKTFLLIIVAILGIILLIMGKYAIGGLIVVYCIVFIVYQVSLFFAEDEEPAEQPKDETPC